MGKRIGTKQRKTRYKFKLNYRQKGKISLTRYFQNLNNGDRVALKINSAVQDGRFYPRFHGLIGKVVGKKGECYEVKIHDGNKEKLLRVHPIHLLKQ